MILSTCLFASMTGQKTSSAGYKPALKASAPMSPITPTRPQPPVGSGTTQSSAIRDVPSVRHSNPSLTTPSSSGQPSSPGISKSSAQRVTAALPAQHGVQSASTGRKRPSLSNDPNGVVSTIRYELNFEVLAILGLVVSPGYSCMKF